MRWITLCFLACLACNKQATPQTGGTPEDGTPSAPPVETNPTPEDTTPDPGMGAGMETALTDEQIAHVLQTANQAEVADGRDARQKSTNPAVQQFADQMVAEHGAADEKLSAWLTQKSAAPLPNPTSEQMQKDHAASKSQLAGLQGEAFDKAYVDMQVTMHEQVLSIIDQELLPEADDPALKAMITEMRPQIAMHLEHGRTLQRQLMGTAAPMR